MNEISSLSGPSTSPPAPRLRALHGLRAHPLLACAVFVLVAVPGFLFAWVHGQPQYVSEAAIQVAPNFTTTLREPDELRDQANRYQDFLQQQVLNIVRYEVLEQALVRLGTQRGFWQEPGESDASAIARLQEQLEVLAVQGSFRINVTLAGRQPDGLAEIVNAVAESYLATQKTETLFAGDDRVKALEDYRVELQADLERMADEKGRLGQELGVTSFERTRASPLQAQVDDTSRALGEARRARLTARSGLDALDASGTALQALEVQSGAQLSPGQDALLDGQLAPLVARRGTLQASLAGLTAENPAGAVARSEIEEIDAAIAAYRETAQGQRATALGQQRATKLAEERMTAAAELQRSESLVTALETELARLQAQLGAHSAAFERGRNLEADMDRTRRRIDETDDRADMFKLESRSPGFARLDSPARTPEVPTRGGRLKYLLVFFVLACGLAVGSTIVAEALDRKIHGARDLERAFGFPPLGWIREPLDTKTALQAEDQVRRLALGIEREARRRGTRRFVLTSVKSHPRASTLVADLAAALHGLGVRVLTVAGNVKDAAAPTGSRGLVDVLEHGADPASVILPGPPGLLPLGSVNGLSRLPESHRLGPVFEQIGRGYDVVLIQAPPLLAASDAELLVSLSEATLLVVLAEEEHLGEVRDAVRLLERLAPSAVGMVLTGVRDPDDPQWS